MKIISNITAAGIIILLFMFLSPDWLVSLITIALSEALVVMGLIMLMRMGFVSFGQGLYYCLGGYTIGIFSKYTGITDIFVLMLVALFVAGLASVIIGMLLSHSNEIFFVMLTLAFSMLLYGVLVESNTLGSTDGLNIARISFFGWYPSSERLPELLFLLAATGSFGAAFFLNRYFRSEAGFVGKAIDDNAIRITYLGTSYRKILYYNYIVSALLAAAGGVLISLSIRHVTPQMAYWTTSGEFVFIAVFGGSDNASAAIIGAILYEIISTFALEFMPYTWQMTFGIILLITIFFFPNGVWSILSKLKSTRY